jgi:hypothetical protein
LAPHWKLQWVAVVRVALQVVVHQVVLTEKVKQHIRVEKVETPDQTHTQVQAEVAEEPL